MMAFARLLEHRPDEDDFEPVRPTLRPSQPTSWSGERGVSSNKKQETDKIRKIRGQELAAEKKLSQNVNGGHWMPERRKYKTKKSPLVWNADLNASENKESEDDPKLGNPCHHVAADDLNSHTPYRTGSIQVSKGSKRALEHDSESSQDMIIPVRKLKFTRPVVSDEEEGDDEHDNSLLQNKAASPKTDLCDPGEDQEWTISSSDEADEEADDEDFEREGDESDIELNDHGSPTEAQLKSEYWKNLLDHLKELCCLKQGQELKQLLAQWYLTWVQDLDEPSGYCPCGKQGIRYLFHIQNFITKKTTYVGSKCIELFKPLDKNVVKVVRDLLCDGITGTLIDKTNLTFEISANCGLVKARNKLRSSGSLPLRMPREAKASCPVLTVKAAEKVITKIHKLKEGKSYKIKLQLFLRKDRNSRGLWTVEMMSFVPVLTRDLVPRDVKQFIRE
ncbi:uncharacterized protein LOC119732486 isoform X2 [Patiria miniata]|nr:uncharacterized protein LOC119732486 isoform X2 [Patiria miniata]XP_038061945.1 uncharacterized protein LOC119732486 isoform X2 [Patiria miniata]